MVSSEDAKKFITNWLGIIAVGTATAAVVTPLTNAPTGILSGIVLIIAIFVYLMNKQVEDHLKSHKGIADAEKIIGFVLFLLLLYIVLSAIDKPDRKKVIYYDSINEWLQIEGQTDVYVKKECMINWTALGITNEDGSEITATDTISGYAAEGEGRKRCWRMDVPRDEFQVVERIRN